MLKDIQNLPSPWFNVLPGLGKLCQTVAARNEQAELQPTRYREVSATQSFTQSQIELFYLKTLPTTSNSATRIFGRKSIKTIYTLSVLSSVIQDFKENLSILLCFTADNFIFWTLSVTSAMSPVSVTSFSIMEE